MFSGEVAKLRLFQSNNFSDSDKLYDKKLKITLFVRCIYILISIFGKKTLLLKCSMEKSLNVFLVVISFIMMLISEFSEKN